MERIQAKAKAQAAAKGAAGAAAGAGAAAADGSGAADPAQHALIQGLTGLAVNGKQQPGSAHGRSNSTAFTAGSGAGASSAGSQTRHAATPSGWGFPALFGRPTPVSSAASSSSASSQPGGRDLSFKRPSTTGDSFSMEDHELYSGIVSNGTAYAKHGGTGGASASTLLSTGAAASSAHWHLKSLEPSERELVETEVIKVLMESYFRIVRKTIADQVPKAIICFLVTRVKKELQAQLVAELYQASLLDTLLAEADDIAEKRESCKELLAILERAMAILNTARDFNAMSSV